MKENNKRYPNPLASGKFRNAPCVCGSGKKVKKCCGINYVVSEEKRKEIINNYDKMIATNKKK